MNDILEKISYLAYGFEGELNKSIIVKYVYTSPGKFLFINEQPLIDYTKYTSISVDMTKQPKGIGKYAFYDRCKEKIQKDIIKKIVSDKGSNKTFVLTARPQVQADKEKISLQLGGRWFPTANMKTIQPPIGVEEPFPHNE